MQTTLELPEPLVRRVEDYAAKRGQTLEQVVREALASIVEAPETAKAPTSWLERLPRLSPEAEAEARELDKWFNSPEFRKVDPEDWQ